MRFHDLHHIVTGYHTDWRGEFQISAWEVGAGCANAWFAWAINLTGFFVGMFTIPRRTFRAFVRGRKSQSLYRFDFEKLLEQTVAEIRERTDCSIASEIATLADTGAFFFWFGAACVVVAPQFLAVLGPIIWLL